ncbi:iron-containing alcohol dehydrogenase [Paenibacillus sp. OV219]|uniref:iron-containing alcohol dehydrogenase n=1 Tax=Paenibacillus sp. OV219 TaxID=1884377 RepID=UPI0008BC9EF3|nr:iron-containing alcohol dehydrogenase [Paenibacillus sp. OV219]SEM74135.1 Alcohol dehydrogenase YqhD, Fe-dependent ADH family [Paenibacillus sp. OV219]
MNSFSFQNSTNIVFGQGTVSQLASLVAPYGKTVLLVYGGGSIKRSGLYDEVLAQLNSIDAKVVELAGVEPNPRLTSVNKGIELCRSEKVDLILAVGGGSVIDAAKAIAAGALYDGDVWDFLMQKAQIQEALPIGTILTLSATGSEMNGNAVISNWETKQKRAFSSLHVYPRFSILDPTLTYSVPSDQTVNGVVDIMSHVFEQYFTLTENAPLQERLCESVLLTVIENAEKALENPNDYDARANLMLCGTMALNGGLISVGTQNDWASHGIEHEVSAIYDIPHGSGLSILFPNWMKYVYKERIDRFTQYAERVWGVERGSKSDDELALAGIEATREFFNRIGAPATLAHYNIGSDNLDVMAREAVLFGPLGNFKKLQQEDVRQILELAL